MPGQTASNRFNHSLRAGCAITLALSGAPLADIMSHVGWKSERTAMHYMKLAQVLSPDSPSALLSSDSNPEQDIAKYQDLNSLKGILCALPNATSSKTL